MAQNKENKEKKSNNFSRRHPVWDFLFSLCIGIVIIWVVLLVIGLL